MRALIVEDSLVPVFVNVVAVVVCLPLITSGVIVARLGRKRLGTVIAVLPVLGLISYYFDQARMFAYPLLGTFLLANLLLMYVAFTRWPQKPSEAHHA